MFVRYITCVWDANSWQCLTSLMEEYVNTDFVITPIKSYVSNNEQP